jgi:CheY-like chemotaxis protein
LLLINDILDLSRVEAGKLDVHPEPFALASLAEDLRTVFEPLAAEKSLDFSVETEAGVPADVVTDRQRLRQILHNLLSNAVKFTQAGQVELRIGVVTSRAAGQEPAIAFSVTDTGIGISDDSLETIFEAFQQGDGTTSRRYGGTGLGLAISREVADQLGGRITAESEPGRGSTFTLYLPPAYPVETEGAASGRPGNLMDAAASLMVGAGSLTDSAESLTVGAASLMADGVGDFPDGAGDDGADGADDLADGHESLRGRSVLVVDDDLRNAFAITSILELYGLSVMHAPDGQQGIGILRSNRDIDLVLMDVMMPEMDGYTTMATIRQMPEFEDLPIIAVTARAMPGDRDKSLAAGATDYVTKPVDTDQLFARMTRWLGPQAD